MDQPTRSIRAKCSIGAGSGGWQLSAATRNRQSLERFQQFVPALVERFARASLGTLELSFDPVELMPSSSAET